MLGVSGGIHARATLDTIFFIMGVFEQAAGIVKVFYGDVCGGYEGKGRRGDPEGKEPEVFGNEFHSDDITATLCCRSVEQYLAGLTGSCVIVYPKKGARACLLLCTLLKRTPKC